MAKVFRYQMFRYYSKYSPKTKTIENPPKRYSKQALEIIEHYKTSKFFQENFKFLNKKYLVKKSSIPTGMIIIDEFVAKDIISVIKDDLKISKQPVFEANPGLGLITKELLKLDLPKICVFEWESIFKRSSSELLEKYDDRLIYYNTNILELWKLSFLDKMDKGVRLKGIMEHVPIKDWEDEPSIRIFGALPSISFISTIISSIIFRHGIATYGRPEMFIIITPLLYSRLNKPNYGIEYLFNMFFDWKSLLDVDNRALLPWIDCKPVTFRHLIKSHLNPHKYILLKAIPKKDLYQRISPELMKPLWYFSKLILRGRKQRILPSLEKWIPGCGPRLIAKGIDAYTDFSELSSEKVLETFLDFTSWPEFSSSGFLSSMEDYLMRYEADSEETLNSETAGEEQIVTEIKDDEKLEKQS